MKKGYFMRPGLLLLLLTLGGCNYNIRLPYIYEGEPGVELQPGETSSFSFFTNDSRADSGISLVSGVDYAIRITLLSNWTDGTISADENGLPLGTGGFADSLMPGTFYNLLKRSRTHRWFELMLYQDNCPGESLRGFTELQPASDSDSYAYRAVCSGKLSMHVNDAFGFYGNNAGYANVAITRQ